MLWRKSFFQNIFDSSDTDSLIEQQVSLNLTKLESFKKLRHKCLKWHISFFQSSSDSVAFKKKKNFEFVYI